MIDAPEITETREQATAVIRLRIPREEIKDVMGPGFAELMGTLAAQNITPTGPAFSHHFRIEPGYFDFELGVPVSAPVTPVGRVLASRIPRVATARTIHRGPYEGLADAWEEFDSWIFSQGHVTAPDLWEHYLVGPESESDPSDWQTMLEHPLALPAQ